MKSYNYKSFKIEILYEDDQLAILNKPFGLLTHKKNFNDQEPSLCESLKFNFDITDDEPLKEALFNLNLFTALLSPLSITTLVTLSLSK